MADSRTGPGVTEVEDAAAKPEETATGDETAASDGSGRRNAAGGGALRRAVAPLCTVVLCVLALVAATLVVVSWRETADAVADRDQIADVSTRVVHDFISINADNAKANADSMLEVATEPFKTELGRFSEMFGAILSQGKVKAEGGVDSIGVEQLDDTSATALVSASTTVRNTEVPNGAPRDFRLLLGLKHEDGAWKVSTVEVAP